MLNKRERYKILKFFRICCNLGPLPLEVNLANWQLKVSSNSKQRISIISYSLFVLHVAYKSGSLVYTYLFVPDVQLHQLVIHALVAMGSIMTAFWYSFVYIGYPSLFATFVKATLLGNIGGPLDPRDHMKKEWKIRLTEYSLQDLVAISLPYMVIVLAAFVVASFVYDPSMRLLLYAALPTQLQNRATFGLCLLEEIRFLAFSSMIAGSIWEVQVISFDLVCNHLQLSMRTIQKEQQPARSGYKYLRCLQVYMSMLNKINSNLIFTWKLVSISGCILGGYAAIAHFRDHPLFGSMYYVLLFDCAVIYLVTYEKAFKIPQLFDRTATCALLRMNGYRTGVLRRQILSVQPTGIKVGNFHRLERTSTLIFVDYVLVNIVNMLVAFR